MTEGVDYSRTANANWAQLAAELKANGKKFVGRYAVNDKSPNGRGITGEEYRAMRAAGLDVFLYWQTTTNWMLGGYAAGVAGAVNAQNNITAAGIPADTPVYFACDFDATPAQQAAIDDCLRGAASVIGADRVGLYAGYFPLMRAMQNGTARWLCQTTAWSGGNRLPQSHLYQYEYNQWYGGTNCDDVRAYAENFGQAGYAPVIPAEPAKPEKPKYATPLPITWKAGDLGWKKLGDVSVYCLEAEVEVVRATTPLAWADGDKSDGEKAPNAGPKIKQGERVKVIGSFANLNEKGQTVRWLIRASDNARIIGSSCRPLLPFKQ